MSTVKTKVEETLVREFLQQRFADFRDFEIVAGGEGSQTFSFSDGATSYVIRINTNPDAFKKDAYAFEHFHSAASCFSRIRSSTINMNSANTRCFRY